QPAIPANGSPTDGRVAGAGPLHSVSWAHGSGPTSGKKASDHVGTFRRSGLLGLVLLGTGLGSAGLGGHRGPAARVTAGRHRLGQSGTGRRHRTAAALTGPGFRHIPTGAR